MNTLQRIQSIQQHFEETHNEQVQCNMQKAGFDVQPAQSINDLLRLAVKKNKFKQPMIYKMPLKEQVWSTKGAGIGS